MITSEMLEVFQMPPTPSEPDVGTVDPFTETDLASIARYNDATGILEDCLDGFEVWPDTCAGHAAEFGAEAAADYIKRCFGWLHEWFEAIDTLDSDLRDGNGYLPNGAERALAHEMFKLFRLRDYIRADALRYLIGDAGPAPDVVSGSVMLSNGFIGCVSCGY